MKGKWKSLGTTLFTVCLLFLMLPIVANATDTEINGTCGEYVTWTFNKSGGVLTISGEGEMERYSYANSNSPWENYSANIESIVIEAGVTGIGRGAFKNLTNLTSVIIPENVQYIEDYAFKRCSKLRNVVLPDSVKLIGKEAFEKCTELESVKFPEDEVTIEYAAF